jgi:hypothetical protein
METRTPPHSLTPATILRPDLTSPFCFSFTAEPTITPCGHLFCFFCLNKTLTIKKNCPICRTNFPEDYLPQICSKIQDFIGKKWPNEFGTRKTELLGWNIWTGDKIAVIFEYGNSWKAVGMPVVGSQGR